MWCNHCARTFTSMDINLAYVGVFLVALMYNSINYFAVSARGGSDDILNQLLCGSLTGALFKCTAGPRSVAAAAIAGGVFVGMGSAVEAMLRGGDIPNPVEKIRERVYE